MISVLFRRFVQESSGATAIEYALIASLVCLAPLVAFGDAGAAVAGLFDQATTELASAASSGVDVLP